MRTQSAAAQTTSAFDICRGGHWLSWYRASSRTTFAWVVNSRVRLANSEGLFCHSESNHRGNSLMRKPRHTSHHLAALLCLLFLPRPPSSPLSLLFFFCFLFFITHNSSCVTHIILFAPSLTPFLSFPLSPPPPRPRLFLSYVPRESFLLSAEEKKHAVTLRESSPFVGG